MEDLSFLYTPGEGRQGNAILKAVLMDGRVRLISDQICPYIFLDTCPLLYHAFEYGMHGRLQANIEVPSEAALISLLRYCYTGSYLSPALDDGLPLLLPHVEIYKMAEDFDIPELQLLAHGNFSCHIELACCLPAPPPALVQTVHFLYRYYSSKQVRQQHGLVSTLLNYIISKFLDLRLGENPEFVKAAAEIPEFCKDLCCTNMERNFDDACAFDIIRLCLDTLRTQPYIPALAHAPEDAPGELDHQSNAYKFDHSQKKVRFDTVPVQASDTPRKGGINNLIDSAITTLVHRPKTPQPGTTEGAEVSSSDEEDGFTVVRLPEPHAPATPDMLMSSPEVVPTSVADMMTTVRIEYASDDDWTML
ncbi:uncharacterized protein yc1106_01133 [Curvularia clavata]|uniref:BTB domain-containing protein n=1 Tax=Curvularia clavata TaxID=95742 RepID=A0A9Q8Z0Y9_CURCL|nr:uncharacterized protein yc1106_01133 [Curvularia clavata]